MITRKELATKAELLCAKTTGAAITVLDAWIDKVLRYQADQEGETPGGVALDIKPDMTPGLWTPQDMYTVLCGQTKMNYPEIKATMDAIKDTLIALKGEQFIEGVALFKPMPEGGFIAEFGEGFANIKPKIPEGTEETLPDM